MRSWLAVPIIILLAGCDGEDPRIALCKAAVTESVDSAHPIKWIEVSGEPMASEATFRREPDYQGEKGAAFYIKPSEEVYAVTAEYHAVVPAKEPLRGSAVCKFSADPAHGYRASTIEIDRRHYDPPELDRLTQIHLPVGTWRKYACAWYRFWDADCK